MRGLCRQLAVAGLVLMTGPTVQHALAQDYVDVEAERAAREQAQPDDPYRVKPAQAYPAASFGASTSPAAAGMQAGGVATPDVNVGKLLYQLQQLQEEVRMLNGKIEEQGHELRRLRAQVQDRYVDLDRRITDLSGSTAAAPAGSAARAVAPAASAPGGNSKVAVQAGEKEAYNAAYALVRGRQWDQALRAFKQFLDDYPAGRYAPNAHYWMGELYLVSEPVRLEEARQAFQLLVSEYPDSDKVPGSLYKLGTIHFLKGSPERGREYLDRVISRYPDSSAAPLARDFIAKNY